MRKVIAFVVVGGAAVLGAASPASAEHEGCAHRATGTQLAHTKVTNHTAHMKIPYCPPTDAPGRR